MMKYYNATIYCKIRGKVETKVDYSLTDVPVWMHNDFVLHREGNKPAIIIRDPETNKIVVKAYFKDGKYFRENDKPSLISIFKPTNDVVLIAKEYRHGNILNRVNGPSSIHGTFTTDGSMNKYTTKKCYKHGVLHEENGPAVIETQYQTGKMLYDEEYFYLSGTEYTEEQYNFIIKKGYPLNDKDQYEYDLKFK